MKSLPRFPPIDKIPSFTAAQRRIYMTATLADDTILVSHFQASAADTEKPIVQRLSADRDVGRRRRLRTRFHSGGRRAKNRGARRAVSRAAGREARLARIRAVA